MDYFVSHVAQLPRRFGTRFRVGTIGYLPHKRSVVDFAFHSCNFSFILSGHGYYSFGGREWAVESPCVITQWPGDEYYYGPDDGGSWEELYLIYDSSYGGLFESCGMYRRDNPVWYLSDSSCMRRRLEEIRALASGMDHASSADRLDLACEAMIVESLEDESLPPRSRREAIVRRIVAQLGSSVLDRHDFDEIARENGISGSTLRRYWRDYQEVTPAKHVMRLRMMEACRQLVETDDSIGEIAAGLGFRDPLYFSRRFREDTGMTASEYRRQNRYRPKLST